MSNPELMLDPSQRSSWRIVFGVVAFFAVYLSVSAYREGLLDGPADAPASAGDPLADDVHKVRASRAQFTRTRGSPLRRLSPCRCLRTAGCF